MHKFILNITNTNRNFCRILLNKKQTISQNTLFRYNLFDEICENVQNKNKIIIIRNIISFICFFVQILRIYDVKHFNNFYEIVNENWNNMIEFENIFSQSNCSIKFERFAFIQKQLNKLKSFVKEFDFKIIINFIITTRMYFFFICEMKCDVVVFDFGNCQNVQNINIVLRIFVIFFKSMKREKKLN